MGQKKISTHYQISVKRYGYRVSFSSLGHPAPYKYKYKFGLVERGLGLQIVQGR